MKTKYYIIILIAFSSCINGNRKVDLAKKTYSKIQKENLEIFFNTEFGTRGDIELWTYYFNPQNDSNYVWTYDLKNDSFNLTTHPNYELFKKKINDPSGFVKELENKKNRLGVKGISNSPWLGYFMKFWISSSEVLIYLPNGFKIDSESKQRWMDEFNTGIKIDPNWVYLDLNKN